MSVKVIFDKAALELIGEMKANLIATDAVATGKTFRSLESITSDDRLQILGSKSFLFVERGRRPGKKPPFKPILEWVEARNLGGQNPKGVAWRLVNLIAQRGAGSLRTDKKISPRDIYQSVINKQRVERITAQITDFKVISMRSEILQRFRGQGISVIS